MCEVRGVGPNLWMAASQGLGFQVRTVQFQDAGYWCIILTSGFALKILAWGTYHGCHPNMSVIFTDAASLLLSSGYKYWGAWSVVYMFFEDPSGSFPPQVGRNA